MASISAFVPFLTSLYCLIVLSPVYSNAVCAMFRTIFTTCPSHLTYTVLMFLFFLSCDVTATTLAWSERQPAYVKLHVGSTDYVAYGNAPTTLPIETILAIGFTTTKTRFRAYAILVALVCSVWKTCIDDS